VNGRAVWAVARKDVTVIRRSRAMMAPLVIVPVVLLVVVPTVVLLIPTLTAGDPRAAEQFRQMLESLPAAVRGDLASRPPAEAWLLLVHTQMWPPLFLLVPFMVANVIAADSFAGERERRTLESLLYTPPTDAELFVGKVLAAWLPGLGASVLGFVLYLVVAGAVGRATSGVLPPVGAASLVLVAWVAPAFAALGLAAMVLVSMRVSRTQDAIQLGGLLVLPVVALAVGTVKGSVVLRPAVLGAIGAVAWLAAAGLLAAGVRGFRRARLVSKL
jgi:ABC-2 type transport system permease protein